MQSHIVTGKEVAAGSNAFVLGEVSGYYLHPGSNSVSVTLGTNGLHLKPMACRVAPFISKQQDSALNGRDSNVDVPIVVVVAKRSPSPTKPHSSEANFSAHLAKFSITEVFKQLRLLKVVFVREQTIHFGI